ncbi:MAG TPA: Calx-beta domain-containing protein, partial [Pyrinomonadaceae bacterium]
MRPTVVLLAFVCLFSTNALLSHQRALAAASDLDPSFDTDGKQTTDFFGGVDQAQSVALQTDGKIVVAGQATQGSNTLFALARYNPDGSLDMGFGAGGQVTTSFASGNSAAYGVAIQSDGKIVAVGGGTGGDFEVARYNADGNPDNSFDVDGKLTIDLRGGSDVAQAVIIQPDGKIVIAGGTLLSGQRQFALVRLNPDSSLDGSFGESGMASPAFVGNAMARAVTLQPDGKIVVGGESATILDFALARYNPDGSLDASFYLGGKATITFPGIPPARTDSVTSVIVQPDGKIVAGGSVQITNNTKAMGLARFNSDGSLDNSFDGDGRTIVRDFNPFFAEQVALAQQPDGKILAAGTSSSNNFALARFNLDGGLDQTFGNGGKMTTDFGGTPDLARGIAMQSDGKFVVVGLVNGNDFGIARYQGDTPTPVCLYGVTPARQVVPVGGGAGTFEVNAPNGCAWNAVSNAPSWLTFTSPASGAGNGQISYTAAAHSGLSLRTGTITVAGQTFTVAQGGPKVAVIAGRTTSARLEAARANLSGTGLFAQVDAFLLTGGHVPTLSGLQRYDAVLYFVDHTTEEFPASPALVGDALADYVDAGGGVVIGSRSWDTTAPSDGLQGRIMTSTYSPYNTPAPSGNGGHLIKLQPRHPILGGVLALGAPDFFTFNLTLTAGAERIANWASGTPAVATKQPPAGRVVGLNLYPPLGDDSVTGTDGPRLLANSVLWAANTNRIISGRIIDAAGHGIAGQPLTLNDELTIGTDADGNYVFFPRAGGNYTVKPVNPNLVFSPASRTFTNLTGDQTADFTVLSVMQFNTTALAFDESEGRASVVITRTGDLSQSTTVNYSTVDNTQDVGCADTTTLPGVAFARCDYATSLDTITFAPGEAQKTITVPLIDDAYVEPDETFQLV